MYAESVAETNALIDFLKKCPTAFYAVAEIESLLVKNGYEKLHEADEWRLCPGGKYYLTRNMTSVIAFRAPANKPRSAMLAASHTDSPMFKLKANPESEAFGKYVRLNTEVYGGGIFASWFDRPLSVAGRAIVERDGAFQAVLVNVDRDLCVIPHVAVHLQRGMNDGWKINPAIDTLPLLGSIEDKGALRRIVAESAGVSEENIRACDLFLYDRTGGRIWGAQNEFFSSPRIDNLQCAYATLQGFLRADTTDDTLCVYAAFDNEETGSSTKQGAGSMLLHDTLERAFRALGGDMERSLASSFMLSADNGHAMHPNHPELSDKDNAPHMNGGVVIKYNASQKYTTDAVSAALFGEICSRAGVPTQVYANRSDLPGGSTLGSISNTRVAMNTVDIGLAQLSMHSCWETGGCADTGYMARAAEAFYSARVDCTKDGAFGLACGKARP